jgi:transposase
MEHYKVTLTEAERHELESFINKGKSAAKKLSHARVILATDRGEFNNAHNLDYESIAKQLHVSIKTVERVRRRFVEEGVDSAINRKSHSRVKPSIFKGEEEAQLIVLACSNPPVGRSTWTLKLLADKLVSLDVVKSVSPSTVGRALKKNELKPWQNKEWCIPEANADFVCNMEDVLNVYQRPYDADYPVVCMDESSKQSIKETRTPIQARPGSVGKYDTEYERNGTNNIFIATEPLKGKVKVDITDRRTKIDWANFIKTLVDDDYKDAKKVVLVMDNLNTHKGSSLYEAFSPAEARRILDKLEIHYTPKHGSWLNVAEIELSRLARQCLNRRIPDRVTLITEVKAWSHQRNMEPCTVNWQFTTEDARLKLKRLYPQIETRQN